MTPPLLAVWGGKGTVGQDFDVHLIPEEDPDGLVASLDAFLTS
jgi:hypothetical protein